MAGGTGKLFPAGYQVSRYLYARSRWVVSYRGDPFFFTEKAGALGEERIKTFKTKRAAMQAIEEHLARIAVLEGQGKHEHRANHHHHQRPH